MNDARFDRLWGYGVAFLVVALIGYFTVTEWDGLVRLGQWLLDAISTLPTGLTALVSYYATLPFNQLAPSLLVGVLVGLVGSIRVLARVSAVSLLMGAGVGTVSAKVLTAAMQHCTYAPEAPLVQVILGLMVTAVSSLILLVPLWAVMQRGTARRAEGSGYFKRPLLAYLFLLPTLISLVIFLYYPSVQSILLSLNSRRFPLPQERFVCLGNYVALAEDVAYRASFSVTLLVVLFVVVLSLAMSLGIALLASQKIRFAGVYRTLLIWPFALSPVVTGVVFLALFREGGSGLINAALIAVFGSAPSWLRDPNLARVVVVLASVWNILGFNILFYIAGLQNIPRDLLEAAQIDGANRVQRFVQVMFPLLAPFTFFLLVTNVTYAFYSIYGAIDALTQGGPPIGAAGEQGGATSVLIYKLYQDAFTPGAPVGLAAAQALVLFLGVAGLTLLQFRYVETRVTYAE